MSRYPFPIQPDLQRIPSLSSNSGPFLNSKRSNDNLGIHNPYSQFHEGHLPAHGDEADWRQYRNPTKPSVGSQSSFQSWTSEDPAFSSHTSSFSQSTPPSSQQITQLPPAMAPPAHRLHHPRGESLMSIVSTTSSAAGAGGGRHRSNSNNSNISNNHPMHYQQQQMQQQNYNQNGAQQQYNHSNNTTYNGSQFNDNGHYHNNSHLSYSSQKSGHTQSYENQYQNHQPHEQNRGSEQHSSERSAQKQSRISPGSDNFQHQESPRTSQRAHRRREPVASEDGKLRSLDDYEALFQEMTSPNLGPRGASSSRSATTEATANAGAERTLDDYEAMLQEMTSPNLGPKDGREARSVARRQEREAREARSTRQQQRQQQRQQEPQRQREQSGQSKNMNGSREKHKTEQRSEQASLEERNLRRRSSLPSKLKLAPNMFADMQRRNSGSGHLSPSVVVAEPSTSDPTPSPQSYDQLLASQPKRFSWENESVAPRADLLQSNNRADRPDSMQRKGSWHELDIPAKTGTEQQQQQQHQLSQLDPDALSMMTESHRRLNKSPIPVDEQKSISFLSVDNEPEVSEQPDPSRDHEVEQNVAFPPSPAPRPTATSNSRSRPSTPVGGIRPPPGPAPLQGALSRKISPRSGKLSGSGSSGGNGETLQPLPQGSRPRAGSAASTSSMNSFTLERVLTPPPPSSPLPSLPQTPRPTHASTPLATSDIVTGLGIGQPQTLSRKTSRNDDLALLASHFTNQVDDQTTLPTPASSLPMSPELNATAPAAAAAANQAAYMARLKKRVILLEKELASTETELSTRIRDGSELQAKVEQLTAERDALERKLTEMASASMTGGETVSNEHSNNTRSPEVDHASLQMLHDQELKHAVKKVREENEVLFEAMMERQGRSQAELAAQIKEIRVQLVQKDEQIAHLQEEHLQGSHHHAAASTAAATAAVSHESQSRKLNREIERLVARQSSLEHELTEARGEVLQLQALVEAKELKEAEEKLTRQGLESKLETLMQKTQEREQHAQEHQRVCGELEQLRSATQNHEQCTQEHEHVRSKLEGELEQFRFAAQNHEQRTQEHERARDELEGELEQLRSVTQEYEQHKQEHERVRGELEGEFQQLRLVMQGHEQRTQEHQLIRGELEGELERLRLMAQEHEQHRQEQERVRDELEGELEQIKQVAQEHEQRGQEHERVRGKLEQEVHDLRSEKSHHEESITDLERELEAFHARSQQDAMQYQTLQDSVQRLSTKMTRLESQHEDDLQQIHNYHEEELEKAVSEHGNVIADLKGHHKRESEALVERTRRETNDSFYQERYESDAREKVLRNRILEQSSRNDRLEEEIFSLQKALEASNREKEVQVRANRSLERHLSMQHLKEEESLYKTEELERENARLRELLSGLDIAAAKKKLLPVSESRENEQQMEEEENSEEMTAEMMFEQQHRRWAEQAELMGWKLARAEEEAHKTAEQNEELRVALELTQSRRHSQQRFSLRSPSPRSSRVLSPRSPSPLSSRVLSPRSPSPFSSRVLSPPLSA